MIEIWLLYMISECDHKMYSVTDYAQRPIGVLWYLTGGGHSDVNCFHDDRLGLILEKPSGISLGQNDGCWCCDCPMRRPKKKN